MYGDRPGSPRRDERQSFAPQEPWPSAAAAPQNPAQAPGPLASEPRPTAPQPAVPRHSAPHEDDVRVAGDDRTRVGAPAGDTLGFQAAPDVPPRAGAPGRDPRDEIASGHRAPRGAASRAGRRNGMRVAAVLTGAAVAVGGGAVAAFALTGGSGGDAATVEPTRRLADPAPKVDPKVLEEQRRRLALERASRETRADKGTGPDLRPKGEPLPTKTPEKKKDEDGGGGGGAPAGDPVPAGEAQQIAKKLMPGFGFTGDGQFGCLVKLWNKESHWNVHADNPSSAAYGIPQANPGSKMASAGPDWRNNATTQIKWGLGYIKNRYKTPCGAWSHSQNVGWY